MFLQLWFCVCVFYLRQKSQYFQRIKRPFTTQLITCSSTENIGRYEWSYLDPILIALNWGGKNNMFHNWRKYLHILYISSDMSIIQDSIGTSLDLIRRIRNRPSDVPIANVVPILGWTHCRCFFRRPVNSGMTR